MLTQHYVWSGGSMVYEYESLYPTNGTVYVYGINLISSRDSGGNEKFYLYNGRGDVVQLVDNTGTVIKEYSYDAFGNEKNPDGADTNYFRYCGQYFDIESGTYYLRARYYNPANGRFTQQDGWVFGDINDPLSLNLYTYCFNNPVNYIDPSGHDAQLDSYIDENYNGKTTITIVVRQPKDGSENAVQGTNNVGHTFIRLQYYKKDANGKITKIVKYIGFYPKERLNADSVAAHQDQAGYIGDDSNHSWSIAKVYEISPEQVQAVFDYVDNYKNDYNVITNNCTTFAVGALEAAGIESSISEQQWKMPFYIKVYAFFKGVKLKDFKGYNPANAGEYLRKGTAGVDYLTNTTKGKNGPKKTNK
jgi:RHS repeat-associated protein